jgi:hypothetical protein
MKVYEGERALGGAIVIVDGKPLPRRHGEPTSPQETPPSTTSRRGGFCTIFYDH